MYPTPWGVTQYDDLFMLVAISALLLEYLCIRWALGREVAFWQGALAFVCINLLTFPITTLVNNGWGAAAEVIPLLLEPLLYLMVLQWLRKKVPYLAVKVVGANLVSFAVGYVAFHLLSDLTRW
jgi:uncharacterized protein YqgC (DUF456 family)